MQSVANLVRTSCIPCILHDSSAKLRYDKRKFESKTTNHKPDRHNSDRVRVVLKSKVMAKKMQPFPYSIEEVGQLVIANIESGKTLLEALTDLGKSLNRSANAIRRYWNSYTIFHRIEYNKQSKKIVQL